VKTAAMALCCLGLAVMAGANSTVVEVLQPQESSRHVRITILFEGKPQRGVKVEFYRYELGPGEETDPRFSLSSNKKGNTSPTSLPVGHYHVVATTEKNLRADLYLDVTSGKPKKTSAFSMQLLANPFLTPSQQWAAAEHMPIKNRVQEFSGIVYDPSGAVVPGTSIEIVRKRTGNKEVVAKLKSSADGRFSTRFTDGPYIAVFSTPGFRTAIVAFEVTKEGQGDLRVTLQLGSTT
jgi:5-hydroxyisourate hydrolase-like protein (transthyretin family)